MKYSKFLFVPLVFLAMAFPGAGNGANDPDAGQICVAVGRFLEQGQYSRKKLDADLSPVFLKNYLEALDYTHLFFTQQDVDAFTSKYATALADDVLLANPDPAFDIYNLFIKRVEARVVKVKALLKQPHTFASNRTMELNRQKSPWPKDEGDADQLWSDRVEGELLQEKLAEEDEAAKDKVKPAPESKPAESAPKVSGSAAAGAGDTTPKAADSTADSTDPAVKLISHRYDQLLRSLHEQTHEDVVKIFLSTLAQTYDPHSEYLSKSDLENFTIQMSLSLFGIGAKLGSEDGYAYIEELIPGGPAAKEGHLKVNDRITAVAQGNHDLVDVVDMKLDKVVDLIRGKKGTTVRLQTMPAHATDPAKRKIVEIVRDEVKLKDSAAKAEIIEREDANGQMRRLGLITLPSFYADMEHSGQKTARSTTRDVRTLLDRLKQENISGLIMDLRRNGGGSLEEAVNLTGLFVKRGPVVQAKSSTGAINISRSHNADVAYDGPMIVLCNRLSASASEIFAAALQDYGRAVIVGDPSTFGKGTVQTMLEIGHLVPFLGNDDPAAAGALKLTIQKFYRIAGGSTQLRGVISDIKIPSLTDHPDFGEISLKNPMPYDQVDPTPFDKVADHPLFLNELRRRSAARVAADRDFRYITEDLNRYKEKLASNKISLNEKVRRQEEAEDKSRNDKILAERAKRKKPDEKVFEVTLENVDKPELQLVKNEVTPSPSPTGEKKESKKETGKNGAKADAPDKGATEDSAEQSSAKTPSTPAPDLEDLGDDEDGTKRVAFDPVRDETYNILRDMVSLWKTPRTASVK